MKKSEKLEFLKSESPELFELIKDFKEKVFDQLLIMFIEFKIQNLNKRLKNLKR